MSLRRKLILMFLGLAVLPLLLLASFSNWYAQGILRTSAQAQIQELAEDLDTVRDILKEGGKKARKRAEEVMGPVREVTGLFKTYDFVS